MARFLELLLGALPLIAGATAAPGSHFNRKRSNGVQYGVCKDINGTTPLLCGSYQVPLDYTDPESEARVNLEIFKIPAAVHKPRGSIFLNFGGPGAPGLAEMAVYGQHLLVLTGGVYDLINIVPRGTGNTLPYSCYRSDAERTLMNSLRPTAGNASDVALGTIWSSSEIIASTCASNNNETGSYIGTAFTARDIITVAEATEEDGLVRYWGMSYGTVLGATLAAMFPDKMDKVLLDGVQNAHEYYRHELELFTDSDKALSVFCNQCVGARDRCAIAGDYTAEQLQEAIYARIGEIKFNPMAIVLPGGGGIVLDYSLAKSAIYSQLYFPNLWPALAETVGAILTNDVATIAALFSVEQPAESRYPNDSEGIVGIRCSDKLVSAETLEEARPRSDARTAASKIGGDVAEASLLTCLRWKQPAKERYDGDFKAKTKNPVFLISTTADPVTPLVSAYNMSAGFTDSVVLEQNGPGHTILVQASLCTGQAIQNYFLHGKLVEDGTVCEPDAPPFSTDNGWDAVLPQLAAGLK